MPSEFVYLYLILGPHVYRSTNLAIARVVCSVMEHFQFIPPVVLVDPQTVATIPSHLCSGATCSVCKELKIGMFERHRDCSKDAATFDGPFATKQPEIELIKITDELHEAVESISGASGAGKAAVQENVVEITPLASGRATDGGAAYPGASASVAVASSKEDASMPVLEDVSKQVESDHLIGNTFEQDELGKIVDMAIGSTSPGPSQSLLAEGALKLEGVDHVAGKLLQQGVTSEKLGDPEVSACQAVGLPKVSSPVQRQEQEAGAGEGGDTVPVDTNIKIKQEKPDDNSRPEITVLSVRYNCPGMFVGLVIISHIICRCWQDRSAAWQWAEEELRSWESR